MSPNQIVITGTNHYTPMQVKRRGKAEEYVSKKEHDAKEARESIEKKDNREYLAQSMHTVGLRSEVSEIE